MMIKLTLQSPLRTGELFFQDFPLVVGNNHALFKPYFSSPQDNLFKITLQKQEFVIVNLTGDDLVTLNKLPFKKGVLKDQDIIQTGDVKILFEICFFLSDDHHHTEMEDKNPPPIVQMDPKKKKWKKVVALSCLFILILLALLSYFYHDVLTQNEEEKLIAAEGVADVSMALAYAQVFNLKPLKQNWSDPDFLKNNLIAVLSAEYPSFANIDSQGQFKNCPYILRIYTSSNLSQFLVIAQPEPSFLQWLIPKEAIVVDSHAMEMRHLQDLKILNRLLVHPNTLDGSNAVEVSQFVKQCDLIPLCSLGYKKGFAPPKALSLLRPGAEHLIYNAPRYRQFGETLLLKALQIRHMFNPHEVKRFQQQLNELTRFPNIVLYTSQGIQKATEAQKVLNYLVPKVKFLTAFLNISTQGTVLNSHLLLDSYETNTAIASYEDLRNHLNEIASLIALPTTKAIPDQEHLHPLYTKFLQLTEERQKILNPLSDEIHSLMIQHIEKGTKNFESNFLFALQKYLEASKISQDKLTDELKLQLQNYSEVPLEQFENWVKSVGLEQLAQEAINRPLA